MASTASMNEQVEERSEALKTILRQSEGFGVPHEYGTSLVWRESAKRQWGTITGYIRGLVAAKEEEFAEKLAQDIFRQLDFLSKYGGMISKEALRTFEDGTKPRNVPSYKVVLGNDGTFMGFSVLWYSCITPERLEELQGEKELFADCAERLKFLKCEPGSYKTYESEERAWRPEGREYHWYRDYYYRFSFNGGLLYHGPGGSETFSVSLTRCLWSIHT